MLRRALLLATALPLARGLRMAATSRPAALNLPRRSLVGAAAAAAAALPAVAFADGSWYKHSGAFYDSEFEGFETSPSGLQYKVVAEGNGVKPKQGQPIKAHYAGYLLNGKKFDASYDRGSPLKFEVGVGRVIKGWDEALLDMSVGEKRVLKIPSGLAYGSRGAGGVIPPDATLVFFVELVTLSA